MLRTTRTTPKVLVVGAGPAGLTAALRLATIGYQVVVLEKSGDPRQMSWSDKRSFNVTINRLGKEALGDHAACVLSCGQEVIGRAIHTSGGATILHPYGHSPGDGFTSLPRQELVANLTAAAVVAGASLCFDQDVILADPASGLAQWRHEADVCLQSDRFDLIVFADGINGYGRQAAARCPAASMLKVIDKIQYLRVTVSGAQARRARLSPDRIHFFLGSGGVSIGLPNSDGSLSVLVKGQLPGSFEEPPFATHEEAECFMALRNLRLIEVAPDVCHQMVGARRGHFLYASVSQWRLGPRAVLVGDSAFCAPPWAGLGANKAMDDAKVLGSYLSSNADQDQALRAYESNRLKAAAALHRLIRAHATLLNRRLGGLQWRVHQRVDELRERYLHQRSLYQRVCFDAGGLDSLIGSQKAATTARPGFENTELHKTVFG